MSSSQLPLSSPSQAAAAPASRPPPPPPLASPHAPLLARPLSNNNLLLKSHAATLLKHHPNFILPTPRASVQQDSIDTLVGGVREVQHHSFWPTLEAAGNKLVVLDMYTQWCGPCKVMYPKLVGLSEQYADVIFLKLDCNQENKPLAKELGVRTVPTFKIFKNKTLVGEVTGAKYDELVQVIDKLRNNAQ